RGRFRRAEKTAISPVQSPARRPNRMCMASHRLNWTPTIQIQRFASVGKNTPRFWVFSEAKCECTGSFPPCRENRDFPRSKSREKAKPDVYGFPPTKLDTHHTNTKICISGKEYTSVLCVFRTYMRVHGVVSAVQRKPRFPPFK